MRCSDVLYGNMYNHFIKGCDKERTLADRVTQFSLALLEAIPVIGQIISLIESLYFSDEVRPPAPPAPAPVSKEERADSPCARENAVPLYDRKSCVLNLKERPINALMDALNIVVSKPESGYRFELVEPKGSTLYAHVARQKGGVRTEKGFCISWQEIRALLDSYETITSPDDREGASVTAICGNIYVLGDGRGAEFARKVGDRDEIRMICMPKEGRVAGWDTIIRATNPGIVVISWMEGDSEEDFAKALQGELAKKIKKIYLVVKDDYAGDLHKRYDPIIVMNGADPLQVAYTEKKRHPDWTINLIHRVPIEEGQLALVGAEVNSQSRLDGGERTEAEIYAVITTLALFHEYSPHRTTKQEQHPQPAAPPTQRTWAAFFRGGGAAAATARSIY